MLPHRPRDARPRPATKNTLATKAVKMSFNPCPSARYVKPAIHGSGTLGDFDGLGDDHPTRSRNGICPPLLQTLLFCGQPLLVDEFKLFSGPVSGEIAVLP